MRIAPLLSIALLGCLGAPALGGDGLPPFDFADDYYRANGLNPDAVIGRPTGDGPNSVIDDRENGAEYRNVRVLQTAAAYDHSGHQIFFYVTGIFFENAFTDDAAGAEARRIADQYKVYEFPFSDNPTGAVFPKRQELIADLRDGYFSNDPLGLWQVNICNYTDAAFDTVGGQAALAALAAKNGVDLEGTPLIREINEVEGLVDDGYMTIYTPPVDGSGGLRWFMCPVIEDPRDGAITPDAHLAIEAGYPGGDAFVDAFHCLQTTGDWCDGPACRADWTGDGSVNAFDVFAFVDLYTGGLLTADLNHDGALNAFDVFEYIDLYVAGCD